MTFEFNTYLAESYHSATQKARVLTEDWLERNMYCPICGAPILTHFEANKPVADFYCKNCPSEYDDTKRLSSIYRYVVDSTTPIPFDLPIDLHKKRYTQVAHILPFGDFVSVE